MNSLDHTLSALLEWRVIAVLRLDDAPRAADVAVVLADAGIQAIEVTLTTPDPFTLIEHLARRQEIVVGVGSVFHDVDLERAADAGARFYASPIFDIELVELAHEMDMVAMPGAATPTELHTAWMAEADIVKLFPMPPDGARYLRTLLAPFNDVLVAPSGGVSSDTAADLLSAGAAALNVGGWLTHRADGTVADDREISERARLLCEAVRRDGGTLGR